MITTQPGPGRPGALLIPSPGGPDSGSAKLPRPARAVAEEEVGLVEVVLEVAIALVVGTGEGLRSLSLLRLLLWLHSRLLVRWPFAVGGRPLQMRHHPGQCAGGGQQPPRPLGRLITPASWQPKIPPGNGAGHRSRASTYIGIAQHPAEHPTRGRARMAGHIRGGEESA